MFTVLLKYLPCVIGVLVALYWGTKITIHGTYKFIPTRALRSIWVGLGVAILWFVFLEYPLPYRFSGEPNYFKTWFAVFLGIVFLTYGGFASRKALILFSADMTSPIYEKAHESQFRKEELENEPDKSKELPY